MRCLLHAVMLRFVGSFTIAAGLCLGPDVGAAKVTKETFFNQIEKSSEAEVARLRSLLLALDEECPQATQTCVAAVELHRAIVGDGAKLLPLLVV